MDSLFSAFDLLTKGGIIMWPIFICSIIALAIIIERLYFFIKQLGNPERALENVNGMLDQGKYAQAFDLSRRTEGPASRMVQMGHKNRVLPRQKLEEKLSVTGQEELLKMGSKLRVLEVISTISPLMGLLGTVIGMVQAFNQVAQFKGQVNPSLLAGGIWEALLTTAAGLSVAIPTVIMLHFFERKIERISFLMEKLGQHLVHYFEEEVERNTFSSSVRSPEVARANI